jgi:hypothetical protein
MQGEAPLATIRSIHSPIFATLLCVFAGDVQVTYEEHSKFEEEIVFPHFNFVFPGIADQVGVYRSTCFFACCKWKVVYLCLMRNVTLSMAMTAAVWGSRGAPPGPLVCGGPVCQADPPVFLRDL